MSNAMEYMNMKMRFPNLKVGDTVRVLVQAIFGTVQVDTVDVITSVCDNGTVLVGTGPNNRFYGLSGGILELVRTAYPNPPHKHAKLIKAWADGAEIEYQRGFRVEWYTTETPSWVHYWEYRIKAQPVKSDKDIQIEKLEQQAIDLAAAISELKEQSNEQT